MTRRIALEKLATKARNSVARRPVVTLISNLWNRGWFIDFRRSAACAGLVLLQGARRSIDFGSTMEATGGCSNLALQVYGKRRR
jgi:hypothetical protein